MFLVVADLGFAYGLGHARWLSTGHPPDEHFLYELDLSSDEGARLDAGAVLGRAAGDDPGVAAGKLVLLHPQDGGAAVCLAHDAPAGDEGRDIAAVQAVCFAGIHSMGEIALMPAGLPGFLGILVLMAITAGPLIYAGEQLDKPSLRTAGFVLFMAELVLLALWAGGADGPPIRGR